MPILNVDARSNPVTLFSEDYLTKIFIIWYNANKPSEQRLHQMITEKDPNTNSFLTPNQLKNLIQNEFTAKAAFLDEQAALGLEKQLVSDKLMMMKEHAMLGRQLRDMGMDYLKEHGLGSSRTALSAFIEGIKIEQSSRGTPREIAKIANMTDDELLGTLKELLVDNSQLISIEPSDGKEE